MRAIRLTLSIFLLAGVAFGHGTYEAIDTADFVARPDTYEGRLVEVRAEVIAIGADSKSLQLFDEKSRLMIGVNLTQLSKAQRIALICSPERELVVYGQATVNGGRLVIDAHKVESLSLGVKTASQPSRLEAGAGGR
jgi:hypothetical protein